MFMCSQNEGYLSISTALLQNNAAAKNNKLSAFYYKLEIYYRIQNILLLAPILSQLNPINILHSIPFNPVSFFHLHTVN